MNPDTQLINLEGVISMTNNQQIYEVIGHNTDETARVKLEYNRKRNQFIEGSPKPRIEAAQSDFDKQYESLLEEEKRDLAALSRQCNKEVMRLLSGVPYKINKIFRDYSGSNLFPSTSDEEAMVIKYLAKNGFVLRENGLYTTRPLEAEYHGLDQNATTFSWNPEIPSKSDRINADGSHIRVFQTWHWAPYRFPDGRITASTVSPFAYLMNAVAGQGHTKSGNSPNMMGTPEDDQYLEGRIDDVIEFLDRFTDVPKEKLPNVRLNMLQRRLRDRF